MHVDRGDGYAKLWLDPVELAYSTGLKAQELRRARELALQHADKLKERWDEHFG